MKAMYALLAAVLTALPAAVQASPYDSNCSTEPLTDNDFIQCQIVSGPGSLDIKPVIGVGLGFCTGPDLGPANIFPCFTVGAANVGAAIFSDYQFGAAAGNREVSVWAEWVDGIFLTGFDMLVCNDRDYDSTCTNIGDNSDQLRNAYSNEPQVLGAGCGDDEKNKDDKDCGVDPTDAEVANFCMMPAEAPNAPWNPGQVVVFIGAWAAADPFTPNIGLGVSAGTYNVWMKLSNSGGAATTTCVPPACDDRADNDGDGAIDFDDLQCSSYDDNSELAECGDGVDNNDADGLADEDDPACYDPVTMQYDPTRSEDAHPLEKLIDAIMKLL